MSKAAFYVFGGNALIVTTCTGSCLLESGKSVAVALMQ